MFSPSEGFFSVKIVTFWPLSVPQRPQSGWIHVIIVYFPHINGFYDVWSFWAHDLEHFSISASGYSVLGNSEVVTLDVCCSKNMSFAQFRPSYKSSMGSVWNVYCMKCVPDPVSSCVEPISWKMAKKLVNSQHKNWQKLVFFNIFFGIFGLIS